MRPFREPSTGSSGLDLADTAFTFDALHSQVTQARFLVEDKKAHRIGMIKANQPLLHRHLKKLLWRDVSPPDKTQATAHDGNEIRRVKSVTVPRGLNLPYAAQAVQIVRHCRIVSTGKVTLERIYAVTDLTARQARRIRDCAPRPRTLGNREQNPPCARCILDRGSLARAHWYRSPGHGPSAQSRP